MKNIQDEGLKRYQTGMQYTPLTKKALRICFDVHQHQRDKSGMPYVFHPFHLAEQMESEDEICTALLHDVLEDSDFTLERLQREGFPETVLEALALLTHEDGVPYMDYIRRLKPYPLARKVKLADLRHNSREDRLDQVTEWDRQRLRKYEAAIRLLLS